MKALILTEGGKKRGFGHVARCAALAAAFRRRGVATDLVVAGDRSVRLQFGLAVEDVFDWLRAPGRLKPRVDSADIVVVDSYRAPAGFYRAVSEAAPAPVFVDDFSRLRYPRGIVVNGTVGAERLRYPGGGPRRTLAGGRFALLRPEFSRPARRTIRAEIRDVLVSFGGGRHGARLVGPAIGALAARFPRWRLHVIAPRPASARRARFYRRLSASSVRRLMLACDAALCGGGQTTNELAACGVPMVGVRLADNQRPNLAGWRSRGALSYAGAADDPAIARRIVARFEALNARARRSMSARGRAAIDGRGPERVAREAVEFARRFLRRHR